MLRPYMSIALETDAEWKPNPGNATQRLSNVVEKFNLKFGRTRNLFRSDQKLIDSKTGAPESIRGSQMQLSDAA